MIVGLLAGYYCLFLRGRHLIPGRSDLLGLVT